MSGQQARSGRPYYALYALVTALGIALLLIFGHEPPGPAGYIFLVAGCLSALVYSLSGVNILGGGRGRSTPGSGSGGAAP